MSEIPKIARARLAQQAAGAGNHPDADQMTAFVERSLGAREREQVLEHLARCADCREVVAVALPLPSEEAAGVPQPAPGFRWLEWQTLRWAAVAATFVIAATLVFQTYRTAPLTYSTDRAQNQPVAVPAPAEAKQAEPAKVDEIQTAAPDVAGAKAKAPSSSTVAAARDQEAEVARGPSKLGAVTRAKTEQPAGALGGVSGGRLDDYKKLDGGKTQTGSGVGVGGGVMAKAAPSAPALAEPRHGPAAPAAQQQQVAGLAQQAPPSPAPTREELHGQPVAAAESRSTADRAESAKVQSQNEIVSVEGTEKDADKRARNAAPAAKPAEGYEESRSMSLASATMRWIITSEGRVQRTIDNGETWKEVALDKRIRFRAVAAAGADVWAGGEGGALYHSSDSGNHWARVSLPAEIASATIVRVEFTDAEHGSLTTSTGQTWTTSDAGATWKKK